MEAGAMAQEEIALLKQQIDRLDEKKFDLEAWKNRTVIFLERIYGHENSKLKMINDLHYDYSSWSLRDTFAGGTEKDKDPVRIQAKEILEAIIAELETLGIPEVKKEQQILLELLEDDLTGKQIREIDAALHAAPEEKEEKITKILENLSKENLALIIAKALIS
jgi:hypothetical protein